MQPQCSDAGHSPREVAPAHRPSSADPPPTDDPGVGSPQAGTPGNNSVETREERAKSRSDAAACADATAPVPLGMSPATLEVPSEAGSPRKPPVCAAGTPTTTTASSATFPQGQPTPGRIFVGGLAWRTTSESLRRHFSRFGLVADACVMLERDERPRGFGFVTFADPRGAARCRAATVLPCHAAAAG